MCTPYPDSVCPQFQIPQLSQPLQPLDPGDLILHEEEIRQLDEMRQVFDMLDLVEAQVQGSQVVKLVEVLDVGNEVIVEVEFLQRGGDIGRKVNSGDFVLAKTYSLYIASSARCREIRGI